MSVEDFQVQNSYRYERKTYKKDWRRENSEDGGCSPREDANVENDCSPRSDGNVVELPGCSCDMDRDRNVESLMHKKCPVISLAQQQLKRLLEDTDKIFCENTRCCRSMYDVLCICRELFLKQNKCMCALLFLIIAAFFTGLLLGAASCGSYLRKFESPILTCLENLFITDTFTNIESFRGIA